MPGPDEQHYRRIVKHIVEGTIVPLLGAGVNLCGRPSDEEWQVGGRFLPDAPELAGFLASYFDYPARDPSELKDLARISQYGSVIEGSGPLYQQLQELFCANYEPTPVHRFIAALPRILDEQGHQRRHQLIVSTNYDDGLETAFKDEGIEFDLLTYLAEGDDRGKFLHAAPGKEPIIVQKPNQYVDFPQDERGNLERTLILKIHGAVDRSVPGTRSSYVITEDHYIEYLSRSELSTLVPATPLDKMMNSHFLFLGYSLRDWNLRVLFHRIWGEQRLSYKSWAVQLNPDELEEEFWEKRGVDILDAPLDAYVRGLEDCIPVRDSIRIER